MNRISKIAIERIACPVCGAAPRASCRTLTTGLRYGDSYVHSAREQPVREGWRVGYGEALKRGQYTMTETADRLDREGWDKRLGKYLRDVATKRLGPWS